MTMPLRTRRSALAATLALTLGLALGLACGGAGQTSYSASPALTLTLQDPAEGVVVNQPALVVKGQVSQSDAFVACNGQPVLVDATGAFRAPVQLQVGANQVVVEAWRSTDAAVGRGSSLLPPPEKVAARIVRNLTYQQPPLTLVVTAPAEGATFSTPAISVQGTVSDPAATVTMNGNPLPVDPAGAFQGTTTLQVGLNTLAFVATASGGRSATASRTVTYTPPPPPPPTSGPTVAILTPPEGLLTNAATLAVTGTISDAAASLTVYGQPVQVQAGGAWSLTITPPEGRITITATVVNAGGQGQDARHIVVDRTPPRITLTKPVPALTNQPTLIIQGSVDDPTALLTLQNQALTLDASGAFTASYGLAEGPNTLHFRAVDPAGNAGTLDVATVLDTTPPVVVLLTPAEGWISNQHGVAITGTVDDPTARLMVAGQTVTPDAQGRFTFQYTAQTSGAQLLVALATDPAGNTGHATRGFTLDWTAPVLAWIDPTPAQGALVTTPAVPASATVSKPAVLTLNGQPVAQQPASGFASAGTSAPYLVASTLFLPEGPALLTLSAQDVAGNTSQIQRALEVGTTLPRVVIETPAEGAQSRDGSATLTGHVDGSDFTKPMALTVNGVAAGLGADDRFSFPVTLLEGQNSFTVAAVNRFGLKGQATRNLNRFTTSFGIRLDFPLDGLATPESSTAVLGHVFRAGTTVQVNGIQAAVDASTLKFTANVPLQPGLNVITAQGTDQAGNSGSASVRVTSAPLKPQAATYRWDLPVDGTATAVRTIPVTGQADLPGVSAVTLNGQPMALSGTGANGAFQGTINLEANGPNALVLQVVTMGGTTYTERREVRFIPTLPRLQLQAPGSARPGDLIPIQVTPAPGTSLVKGELSWNGRALATVTAPWAAVSAQVPTDAVVGSELAVEAVGTDDQGATVTARTYVTVYGAGALLVEAYDDGLGLPLTDQKATATVEGSLAPALAQPLDQHGRTALATALPESWIQVSKAGFTSVWRSAGLVVGGVQAVVDARLTSLSAGQPADASGFAGSFGGGVLNLTLPAGALAGSTNISVTPLSTQGLPGLLPAGWSAVNAWWLELGGAALGSPGTASLDFSALAAPPALPGDGQYAWARWDQVAHVWTVLAAPLSAATLANLPLPAAGGYALVLADPLPTMPPAAAAGSPLAAYTGPAWRDGLVATGTATPSLLATVAAINGAKVTATFSLAFNGGDPLPSGTLIQTDVLESYTLLDQSVIEPDGFTQDAVAARWLLEVINGKPVLTAAGTAAAPGLGLRLPVRMSRTFDPTQLVEGRILVGYYHDGVQVASSGSGLLGASGGTVSNGGVTVSLPPGAVTGSTLVRVQADAGDLSAIWPELAGQGSLAKAFSVDIVGSLLAGLSLSLDASSLSMPAGVRPLLLQRRVVQGQRLIAAVGELVQHGSSWTLTVPSGGNPVLEGGAFAVLIPTAPWDWISGTALLPASVANPLIAKLGAKARMVSVQALKLPVRNGDAGEKATAVSPANALTVPHRSSPANPSFSLSSPADVAVADVSLDGGFLLAVSGSTGSFAVPIFATPGAGPVQVKGSRWDLGLSGTFTAVVPSAGNTLRLDMRPFQIEAVTPDEGATVASGAVLLVATTTAMDPGSLAGVRLYQTFAAATPSELTLRRSLSQDGRTLQLTPDSPLPAGATIHLAVAGLQGQGGTLAPNVDRHFSTAAQPVIPDVDLSRIQVSYPDDAYNITVTIPAGALAPWSLVEIVAAGMGSDGTGVMPTSGDLVFQMKAFLGERLAVSIQLRDGRLITGFLGRYVAPDGRTTLGVDGGRVEGPGGLAIIVPAGALETSAEVRVMVSSDTPQPSAGSLLNGEQLLPALELRSKDPISFKSPPILELPLSAVPAGMRTNVDTSATFGNGPVAIYQKVVAKLPDGTEDVSYVLLDTAQLSSDGQKLRSAGGLRLPDPAQGSVVHAQPVRLTAKSVAPAQGQAQAQASSAGAGSKLPAAASHTAAGPASAASYDYEPFSVGFFTMYIPISVVEPQYLYTSGTVYRNWNGSGRCGGTASAGCYGELASAEVHRYSGTLGLDDARKGRLASGRLLTTCDNQGRYLNVGGPEAGASPGQAWIALFAVDPRTGETSIDPNSPTAPDLGLPWTRREHSIVITSQGGNPFDPTLTAPRLQARLVDANGNARSTFAVGDTATLKLTLLAGSQPVVRGKLTGAVQQDIGALPTSLPVTFSALGPWHVDVQAWTAKPVQGGTSLDAIVTTATLLGPSLPGAPRILTRDPSNGDTDVEPSATIQLTFTEPVLPLKAGFSVKANGQAVDFTLLSNGQTVDGTQPAQGVWIVPTQRLGLGSKVVVTVQGLLDLDNPPSAMAADTWSFTVRGADQVGVLSGVGSFTQMVANKGRIYAVEDVGAGYDLESIANGQLSSSVVNEGLRMQGVRVIDATDPSNPTLGPIFGQYRSWDPPTPEFLNLLLNKGPFAKSSISGLRVATGVSIGGKTRDILLVATRPWSAQELIYIGDDVVNPTIYHIRHNSLWAFDITGDAASMEVSMGKTIPRLLMGTSQGTLSENWIKGLGSAGGMLGSLRLRGGMNVWDADAWQGSWQQDDATLTDWTIRYRTAGTTGYFPDPSSLVASNGFYDAAAATTQSVLSGVITDDANGQPIGFAAMGYAQGLLALIDGKVGQLDSMATFEGGGPLGMDARIHDLSAAVNNEHTDLVEVIKGTWQGPNGTDQGTLLLTGTSVGAAGHFWVLTPDLVNLASGSAQALGYAVLPGRITRIIPDPAKMLVGIESNGRGYIFDLKSLVGSGGLPLTLVPIYDFAISGAWTMADGLLYDDQLTGNKVVVKNIDGMMIRGMIGAPLLVDANRLIQGGDYEYQTQDVVSSGLSAKGVSSKRVVVAADAAPLPPKLIYAMTDMQGKNNGYPFLRHYYPDLGDMLVSGIVEYSDPRTYGEMTNDASQWRMSARARLFEDGVEVPGAIGILGVRVKPTPDGTGTYEDAGDNEGRIYGDGDTAKIELKVADEPSGNSFNQGFKSKFAYSPFRMWLKENGLNPTRAHAIRTDKTDRYRIKVELDVYKTPGDKANDQKACPTRSYEFGVRYNANTTLTDVIRGGVWYHDPQVSFSDPGATQTNPLTEKWFKALADSQEGSIALSSELQELLSVTPFEYVPAGTPYDGQVWKKDLKTLSADKFGQWGLDMMQWMLNDVLVSLRRQVFSDNQPTHRMAPSWIALRNAFAQPTLDASGQVHFNQSADAFGAFGFRTAQVINAIQAFEDGEAKDIRKLDGDLRFWGNDPTKQSTDQDIEGRSAEIRIAPVLYQATRKNGGLNPDNTLVQYLIAYPGLLASDRLKGRAPINTLLTRDLVIGPGGWYTGDDQAQHRADIDKAVKALNAMGWWREDVEYQTGLTTSMGRIWDACQSQRIITNANSGTYFNRGLGILPLGTQKSWTREADRGQPDYQRKSVNPHLYEWTQRFSSTGDPHFYETDRRYNTASYAGILSHLLGGAGNSKQPSHLKSDRIDVYVNGVLNVEDELERASEALQQRLDTVTGQLGLPDGSGAHVPVIAVWNWSAKQYSGAVANKDWFDGSDLMAQKNDTAQPGSPTKNADTIKLIGILRATVQALWSEGYESAFYSTRLDPSFRPSDFGTKVWDFSGDQAVEKDLIQDYFSKNAVFVPEAQQYQNPVLKAWLVPKIKPTFEEQFLVSGNLTSPAEIWAARVNQALQISNGFTIQANREYRRLRALLEKVQLTLHAHSQGAIIAASASSRCGEVSRSRSLSPEEAGQGLGGGIPVASQFKFVSYGGGANMLDYGSDKRFASYTHHFNLRDSVARVPGMLDPFQREPLMSCLGMAVASIQASPLPALNQVLFNLPKQLALRAGAGDLITDVLFPQAPNAHVGRILTGPTPMEIAAWVSFHKVVYHQPTIGLIPNIDHHNFWLSYVCNAGTEDTAPLGPLPIWFSVFRLGLSHAVNPQEGIGTTDCLKE